MPFLSSTTALAVYTVTDTKAVTSAKLHQFAFRSIDNLPEERGWGWASIENMFDTTWAQSVPEKGEWMCFSLRIDNRKVPSAVLKKHVAEALATEEAKAVAEGRKVSRGRKKEIKEMYAAKLCAQAEPVPSSIDVAVDMETGVMLVGSVSTAQLDLFEQHFAASFDLKPERWLLDPAAGQCLLATLYSEGLSPTVDGHVFTLTEAGQAGLINPENGATVSVKDEPEMIQKARESRLIFSRLKLHLSRQDDDSLEWTFSLSADGSITGLKTPKVEKTDNEDTDAVLLEKLYLLQQAVGVIREMGRG